VQRTVREIHYCMGTLLDLTLFAVHAQAARQLLRRCFTEARRLERLFSAHDPGSALSQLNRHAGHEPVRVERELWHLLEACAVFTRQMAGAFDITAGSVEARDPQVTPAVPSSEARPAYHLDRPGWVSLDAGVRLDLGGIGKGYAVDRLVTMLQAAEVRQAWVNFGDSSLYALGDPPHGAGWPILVRGLDDDELIGLLQINGAAISSSSSCRAEATSSDRHIRDPRTGLSVDRPCLSTIVAPTATLAEALSTAAVVSGAQWADLLARFPGAEGLYMGPERLVRWSEGLRGRFHPYGGTA
jgi:thiamine biosynthesis lipoprotein